MGEDNTKTVAEEKAIEFYVKEKVLDPNIKVTLVRENEQGDGFSPLLSLGINTRRPEAKVEVDKDEKVIRIDYISSQLDESAEVTDNLLEVLPESENDHIAVYISTPTTKSIEDCSDCVEGLLLAPYIIQASLKLKLAELDFVRVVSGTAIKDIRNEFITNAEGEDLVNTKIVLSYKEDRGISPMPEILDPSLDISSMMLQAMNRVILISSMFTERVIENCDRPTSNVMEENDDIREDVKARIISNDPSEIIPDDDLHDSTFLQSVVISEMLWDYKSKGEDSAAALLGYSEWFDEALSQQ